MIIIDDRTDVWLNAPNCIQVRPYKYFKHTGDINAPDGAAKNVANEDRWVRVL